MGGEISTRTRRAIAGRRREFKYAIWRSGCACTWVAARLTANKSSPPTRLRKPIARKWSAIPPAIPRLTAPVFTAWAGANYDELGRVKLSHSGAFDLGAATTVYLLPSEQLGIVILTNAAPIGVAEALAQSFLDLATYGEVKRDWVSCTKRALPYWRQQDVVP